LIKFALVGLCCTFGALIYWLAFLVAVAGMHRGDLIICFASWNWDG
jgi:hypothetical protein